MALKPVPIILAAVLLAAGGCSRLDVVNRRLDAIADTRARTLVRDLLWADGSKYAWADHATLQAEVIRTEHHPQGAAETHEVWLLDLWQGRVRIERPADGLVEVFDGLTLRVFERGRLTEDLEARARAAADVHLVRELLPLPLSLTRPGLKVSFAGVRVGPGEARSWQRLLVAYGPTTGHGAGDETVVEGLQGARRVDNVLLRWWAYPSCGRALRVEMRNWRPEQGLSISRLWRLVPIDGQGAVRGPPRSVVQVTAVAFDAPAPAAAFSRP